MIFEVLYKVTKLSISKLGSFLYCFPSKSFVTFIIKIFCVVLKTRYTLLATFKGCKVTLAIGITWRFKKYTICGSTAVSHLANTFWFLLKECKLFIQHYEGERNFTNQIFLNNKIHKASHIFKILNILNGYISHNITQFFTF